MSRGLWELIQEKKTETRSTLRILDECDNMNNILDNINNVIDSTNYSTVKYKKIVAIMADAGYPGAERIQKRS